MVVWHYCQAPTCIIYLNLHVSDGVGRWASSSNKFQVWKLASGQLWVPEKSTVLYFQAVGPITHLSTCAPFSDTSSSSRGSGLVNRASAQNLDLTGCVSTCHYHTEHCFMCALDWISFLSQHPWRQHQTVFNFSELLIKEGFRNPSVTKLLCH